MINVLHINGNYVGTALHQTMIEHLNKYTNNQVFAPIYPITEDQLAVKPSNNVIISQCYNKRDRYVFSYKQRKILKSLETNVEVSKYDVVHAYTLFTDGNCALTIKKKYGIPYIVAVRDSDVNAFFKKAPHLRKRGIEIMKRANKIIFLSDAYRDYVLRKYVPENEIKIIEKNSIVIPNGIDNMWFDNKYSNRDVAEAEKRILNKKINIIAVGVITQRKNVLKTIEAIEVLKEQGWEIIFTVIGQPIDKELLTKIVRFPYVRYYEKMPMIDLIEYYRSNDIFVMPSITETFGLTYAEALTQQLPIIYTSGQGFDKQFDEGLVGHSVDCTDAEDIARKIIQVANRYDEISSNCTAACDKFKWDSIVYKYKTIYDRAIERSDHNKTHS